MQLNPQSALQTVSQVGVDLASLGGGCMRVMVLVVLVIAVLLAVVSTGIDLKLIALAQGGDRARASRTKRASRARRAGAARDGACGRSVGDHAGAVVGVESEFVGSHRVARLGVDKVRELAMLATGRRGAASAGGD
jgi:hypothetical protein